MEQFRMQDWMVDQIHEIQKDILDGNDKSQAQLVHLGRLLAKNYQLQERQLSSLRLLLMATLGVQLISVIVLLLV